jgi:hypothetical protein
MELTTGSCANRLLADEGRTAAPAMAAAPAMNFLRETLLSVIRFAPRYGYIDPQQVKFGEGFLPEFTNSQVVSAYRIKHLKTPCHRKLSLIAAPLSDEPFFA